ncbi:MAG: 1-(5-phosphoribosyl)-5-[(5-phosphoribosylamino)methylideneamino]imidazole-4-carboxamide isomerase [Kiritimatiellia bacterium]|jgi:phosphoribosylformimino-5-aminoimidazole carboxamide ribotide isomerase
MKILPAIDLKDGQCVRLRQGRMDDATVYSSDPVEMALHWQSLGAECLHIVDLDGAFAGKPVHADLFARIAEAIDIPFEVGGGLRTDDHVREILGAGAARAILGTRAVSDLEAVRRLVERHGDAIAVGIDARGGFVQVKGWVETTRARATDLAADVARRGVATIIYTDTATDGMLQGPNLAAMAEMADAVPSVSLIASGGVAGPADVEALIRLDRANLAGVIVGKALYEAAASLPEFLAAARGR